jgi:hypothetical protein
VLGPSSYKGAMSVRCGFPLLRSPVSAYTAAAGAVLGGAAVTAVAADGGTPVGVLITAGTKLYRVTLSGSITVVGVMQDSANTYANVTPSAVVFASGSSVCTPGTVLEGCRLPVCSCSRGAGGLVFLSPPTSQGLLPSPGPCSAACADQRRVLACTL